MRTTAGGKIGAVMAPTEPLAGELDRCGYVVVEHRLDTDTVAEARRQIGELLAGARWGTGFDGSRTRRAWALLGRTRCMDAAALDPLVLQTVDAVLGSGAQFSLTQATQIHPGQQAQVLHYEQGIYPLPRDRDVMLSAIWALDNFTAANGGTRVVPGSHLRERGEPQVNEVVPIEMPAGSVLLFLGRLWHAGGPNTSTGPRLGVIIDYVQPWLRPCEAHTLSADLDEVRALPQRLQELLGFNQPTPYLGFINGQHPRHWLTGDGC
jgi:ectoine hydroxylase-related dioxygenase (phytanoyl-CoA dioxygenase family)